MSFLKSLKKVKSQLRHAETTVTTPSGQKYNERTTVDGVITSSEMLPSNSLGFVVDMNPDLQMAEIQQRLYLGAMDAAQDPKLLQKYGITHILSLGIKLENVPKAIQNKFVYILDTPEVRFLDFFEEECFPFLDRALRQNGRVLVHCNAGVSRAPSVVIAYLMKSQKMSYIDAYNHVKHKRKVIHPNSGFAQQLQEYERVLAKERNH